MGLPIRRPAGHPEFNIPTHAHTATHSVEAHPARLKLLIENRKLILFGPGGKGVMKELGATLIWFASVDPRSELPRVGLVDEKYYGDLAKFLMSLPLPSHILSQIKILPVANLGSEAMREITPTR